MLSKYSSQISLKLYDGAIPPKIMNFKFTPEKIMVLLSKELLSILESKWNDFEFGLNCDQFVQLMLSHIATQNDDEKYELIHGAYMLFREVDINGDGQMEWGEFMQYIIDAV